MQTIRNNTDEVARAEAQVKARKTQLSRSLRDVEDSGKHLAQRVRQELQPAVHGALFVAGAAAVVGVGVAVLVATRSRRSASGWLAPSRPSTLAVLGKTAGLWALRVLARRAAQELVSRLNEPPPPTQVATATAPH
jgi:hypothetical protein